MEVLDPPGHARALQLPGSCRPQQGLDPASICPGAGGGTLSAPGRPHGEHHVPGSPDGELGGHWVTPERFHIPWGGLDAHAQLVLFLAALAVVGGQAPGHGDAPCTYSMTRLSMTAADVLTSRGSGLCEQIAFSSGQAAQSYLEGEALRASQRGAGGRWGMVPSRHSMDLRHA